MGLGKIMNFPEQEKKEKLVCWTEMGWLPELKNEAYKTDARRSSI